MEDMGPGLLTFPSRDETQALDLYYIKVFFFPAFKEFLTLRLTVEKKQEL